MSSPSASSSPGLSRIGGLEGAARPWWIAEYAKSNPKLLIICKNRTEVTELADDLDYFLHQSSIFTLPGWESLPFEPVSPEMDISAQRIKVLLSLKNLPSWITVTSPEALLQKILPLPLLHSLSFILRRGDNVALSTITDKIARSGFKKVSLVEEIGEYAARGQVIDVFPSTTLSPVRVQFEGGQISEIKLFDADTQRTTGTLASVEVLPVRELFPIKAERFTKDYEALLENVRTRGQKNEVPPHEIAELLAEIASGGKIPGLEQLLFINRSEYSTIFDALPPDTKIIVVDDIACFTELSTLEEEIKSREVRLQQSHHLIATVDELYLSSDKVTEEIKKFPRTYLDSLKIHKELDQKAVKTIKSDPLTELSTKMKTKIGSGDAFQPLHEQLTEWRRKDYAVAFSVGSPTRAEKLHRILLDLTIDAPVVDLEARSWTRMTERYPVAILNGHLSAGAVIRDEKIVFVAEHEIFSERSYRRTTKAKTSLKKLLGSLAQLAEDDYVVHADYGIGIYRGLQHLEVDDSESDFLQIDYADSKLYLPVQNIGKVQKFVGAEGQKPQLDKLGSNRWVKTKEKIKQAVLPLAGDLIKLYASRSVVKGWRYDPFGAFDEQFADEFAFNETPDQLKAIEETISDMAADKPMDRLVCGDVGFGKTEVAIRAAFKATQHKKQVAMLVPTTLLVEQHYKTFVTRLQGYPVKIGLLSRFNTTEETKKILNDLREGELDILIGTHRVLSRDVEFFDLGLVIIDEEHRFGVKQKEQLKALKKQVDVLTLTATPIPRTLHMSLLGIRDISVISTPPVDRRITKTYIANFDDLTIRDALLREIHRGGQAFYVHNRVQSIAGVTDRLKLLVPEARFKFAHGQMSEHQLEEIMHGFIDKQFDVLVTTTIIESGIDIPSANTIIIERADAYGLAQLYQLRGRVGRSDKQAYCYFIVPKANKLSGDAQQRLKALQSLDELGLGFNLAIRDLEIRGAGNLLGKEQSGSVLAVGFDLYSKILKEAVLHLKGEEPEIEEIVDPEVKLGLNAFIPEWYIPDISERLILYQRLSGARESIELDELWKEMEDRFGKTPQEVSELVELMRFRALLRRVGVVRAELKGENLHLAFSPKAKVDAEKILELAKSRPKKYRFGKNLTLTISMPHLKSPIELYAEVERTLNKVGKENKEPGSPAMGTALSTSPRLPPTG